MEWQSEGRMSESARTALMSTLYKKNDRTDWANYRPVSVCTVLYRVYGGCLEQCLAPLTKYVIGDSQVGYCQKRKIDENINLITEIARYLNHDAPAEGGLLLMLDNMKAFDRVQWPFMYAALEAFGFTGEFVAAVKVMYTDISTIIKTNGVRGEPFQVTSGIRQGCVLSGLLYVIVQEVQLRMIRRAAVAGVQIPGPDGDTGPGETVEVKERADSARPGRLDARNLHHHRGVGRAQQPHAGEQEQARPCAPTSSSSTSPSALPPDTVPD